MSLDGKINQPNQRPAPQQSEDLDNEKINEVATQLTELVRDNGRYLHKAIETMAPREREILYDELIKHSREIEFSKHLARNP